MDKDVISSILNKIDSYRDDVLCLQTELTAIPALGPDNGGQGETDKAEYLKKKLHDIPSLKIEEINAPDARVTSGYRPNLIATLKGKSDKHTVWIMSHMDIVPPGDITLWENDPYTVIEKEGKLIGRGTEDNQQGIVSSLLAIKAMADLKIKPEYQVGLVWVADEETGSKYGIHYVLNTRPDLFKTEDLIIIPDAGDEKGILIEVAEKSILWIRFEIQGKQTHGSTPEKGINAHKAGAHLIVMMNGLYEQFNKKDPLYNPPISTFEPTKKENNIDNINTIPGTDIIYFDCRILPDYSLDEIKKQIGFYIKKIEKEFGVTVSISFPQDESAPPPTPADTPASLALSKAVKEIKELDSKTIGIGGGTVAAYFRHAGLPAVCWCTLDDTLHAPNEYCKIENVISDAKVFAHIFLQE